MSKLQEPFRYDYVGSFLRTEELKKATTQYNENKITKEVYDNIVNEEIAKLVAKKLQFVYVDTGAMYRAMGLYFIKNNLDHTVFSTHT